MMREQDVNHQTSSISCASLLRLRLLTVLMSKPQQLPVVRSSAWRHTAAWSSQTVPLLLPPPVRSVVDMKRCVTQKHLVTK